MKRERGGKKESAGKKYGVVGDTMSRERKPREGHIQLD